MYFEKLFRILHIPSYIKEILSTKGIIFIETDANQINRFFPRQSEPKFFDPGSHMSIFSLFHVIHFPTLIVKNFYSSLAIRTL